jgi:6-phosphogluconolactonase (cycloisomerase 2 family)
MFHATSRLLLAAALTASALLAPGAALAHGTQSENAVYTITNAASGNEVLAFHRAIDGPLTPIGAFATGGLGSGAGLGSGHSLVTSQDGRQLVVVNAGSDSISAFRVGDDGLHLIGGPVSSGGMRPTSVTLHNGLVYVMNAGSNSIAGFWLDDVRGLQPIAGSIQALGAGTSVPSQIQFDKTGRVLIVDERGSSTIDTFVVDRKGVAGPAHTAPSNAGGPFGFDVDPRGNILFSAVALGGGLMSGATSYDVNGSGMLSANGAPVSSGQAAACWLAAAGRFAYTTNAGSGSIGRFAIGDDGSLSLIGTTVVGPGTTPLDDAASRGLDYLYVLLGGTHQIVGYHIGRDGNLTRITSVAVPVGAAGLAAR